MPHYEYTCEKCNHKLEAFQKISDPVLKQCPQCQQEGLRRGPGGGIGLMFKGSGFYLTDYARVGEKMPESDSTVSKPSSCGCGSKHSCEA